MMGAGCLGMWGYGMWGLWDTGGMGSGEGGQEDGSFIGVSFGYDSADSELDANQMIPVMPAGSHQHACHYFVSLRHVKS